MKTVKMYFLISIVAIFTITYMRNPHYSGPFIATIGLLTLYSYMVGRLQQKRMILQINNRFGNFSNAPQVDMRFESMLIVASLVYFTLCLYKTDIPYTRANLWFYNTVNQIYDTPVIGWIIGFFGILFLLATLLKAALVTVVFINRLMGGRQGNKNNDGGNRDGNDGYADYEIME
ncbi:MAG TPA: hypothetical protein VD905_16045 [Flavobacteriales bacterium]|nr:hypothetical protein [Flavobacteriales bacterium]